MPSILKHFLSGITRRAKHLCPSANSKQYHLIFGDYPNIDRKLIPKTDSVMLALDTALKRCRSFLYDVEVFKSVDRETQFLHYLTSRDKISLDVGANVGFYSALLSPLSSEVFAWEANPHIIPYLTTNVFRYQNVRILPLAAANEKGTIIFNVPLGQDGDILNRSGSGSLSNEFMIKQQIKCVPVKVPMFPLDSFGFENVGFIKIDVEGAEYSVLRGADKTIAHNRPAIAIENEFRHNQECQKVFDFLKDRNYNGYFFDRNSERLRSFDHFSLEQHQISLLDVNHNIIDFKSYIFNFLFVPSEADPLRALLAD